MKIFLTLEYPFHKLGYGGGSQIIIGLAESLSKAGHDISIITSGVDQIGVKKKLPQSKIYATIFSKNRFLINPIVVGFYAVFLIFLKRPNAVVGFGGESFFIAIACRLLNINFYSFLAAPKLPDFSQKINLRLNAGLYLQYLSTKSAKSVFTLSNYLSNQAVLIWKINTEKVITIGGGLDKIFIEPVAMKKNAHILKKSFRVLTIGRIAFDQKPINILCEAINLLGERISTWTIIGSGQDILSLRNQVSKFEMAEKVNFLGTVGSVEIKDEISRADIVVLPSNHESLMLTAYEAVSQNKITLLNDVADLKSNFQGYESVIILDNSSCQSFYRGISYSMDNFNRLSLESNKASKYVQSLMNWNSCAEKLNYELLKDIA